VSTNAAHAGCDGAQADAHGPRAAAHPAWTLVACICASSLAFIDGSVVNVARPAIRASLGGGAADAQWAINAYLLPLSALLLLGGAAGDRFGRRRLLIGGTTLFALASVGCAIAPDLPTFLAARAMQGIGAALLMPNSLAILGNAFEGEAKGRAIGTWASAGAIAGAIGPPLGGWLVENAGWRAIFYLNLPLSAAAVAVAWAYVRESDAGGAALDWLGALLATAGLFALTWGLTIWSSARALTPAVWLGVGLGVGALIAFVLVERARGERAMMPLALFARRAFIGLSLLTFLLYGALGGLLVLLPYVLIEGGYTPLQAGLSLLPFSILIGTVSRAMGALAQRTGSRLPLSIGPIVTGIGFALLTRVDPQASYWSSVLPGVAVIALGMAGAVAPLTTAVLSAVDARHTGTASGFNSAISRTGGLIATALSGAVIAAGAGEVGSFHAAALVGAGAAVLAGAIAWVTLK
jgi:EmrB/QacA subfamily drug resistance transporter